MTSTEKPGTDRVTSNNDMPKSASQLAYEKENRTWQRTLGAKQAEADGKTQLAEAEGRIAEADDRRSQRSAESYRERLINPGRALARNWRAYRGLLALEVVGLVLVIGWNATKVAAGLGGPNATWTYYFGEAPLSLPLLIVLFLQVVGAQNGRLKLVRPMTRPEGAEHRRPTAVGLIEAYLLIGSVAVCVYPSLSAEHPRFEEIATSALPPFSLVILSTLIFVTTELFAEIFRDSRSDEGADNVRRQTERAMDLALDVERAQAGDNPLPVGEDGLPSISAIGRRFKGEKALHQTVHDLLARFQSRKEIPSQQSE